MAEGRVSRLNAIYVVDDSGEIVSEGTVISQPSAIAKCLKTKAGSARRIGLETGPTTTWLWHELRALGLPVIGPITALAFHSAIDDPVYALNAYEPSTSCSSTVATIGVRT